MTTGTTVPETGTVTNTETGTVVTGNVQPRPEHDEDPWEGIPAEVLDGTVPYDTDTTGGCG